jgi:hypothetical protein
MGVNDWLECHHHEVVRTAMGVVLAGMVGGGVYSSSQFFTLAHQNSEKDRVIAQLSKSLDSSRNQLQADGIAPTSPSAREIVDGTHPSPTVTLAPGTLTVAQAAAHGAQDSGLPVLPAGVLYYAVFDPKRRN